MAALHATHSRSYAQPPAHSVERVAAGLVRADTSTNGPDASHRYGIEALCRTVGRNFDLYPSLLTISGRLYWLTIDTARTCGDVAFCSIVNAVVTNRSSSQRPSPPRNLSA